MTSTKTKQALTMTSELNAGINISRRTYKNIIKEAQAMWDLRRPGRPTREQIGDVTAALRHKAVLADRKIWLVNYEAENRTREGERQHEILKENWRTGQLKAPVVAGGEVIFDGIDDFEEISLAGYHWKSWIIDLTEREPFFGLFPTREASLSFQRLRPLRFLFIEHGKFDLVTNGCAFREPISPN
jgi:hypothetical protein